MIVILVMGISTFGSAIEKLPCSTDVKDIKIVYIGKCKCQALFPSLR